MKMKQKVIDIYKQYGFTLLNDHPDYSVLVFRRDDYYNNVDLVIYNQKVTEVDQEIIEYYKAVGYQCVIRQYEYFQNAQDELFKAFFKREAIKQKFQNSYKNFTESIVKNYNQNVDYEYLNVPFVLDSGSPDEGFINYNNNINLIDKILEKLSVQRPILFLIEAAAGFGKTCTAYEVAKHINNNDKNIIPLFSELSRNREARVFKHILLDEIDKTFSSMNNSELVKKEILSGRIITILDGFDELLRGDFENSIEENDFLKKQEPMLETIAEYLNENAKIILTTRRTILFEGNYFGEWLDKYKQQFEVIRIRLLEPTIKDWIQKDRYNYMESLIDINIISNPVLLSYLRYISYEDFKEIVSNINYITDRYFDSMLKREMERQDLQLSPEKQKNILMSIAKNMIEYSFTTEDRDYIVDYIKEFNLDIIEDMLLKYSPSNRPTIEEVANKLASHAFLDKSHRKPNQIGFINDFVLGNYCAEVFIESSINSEWRFIEAAILAYQSKNESLRLKLFRALQTTNYENLTTSQKINIEIKLLRSIQTDISNSPLIEKIKFEHIDFSNTNISKCSFLDCDFNNCIFNIDHMSHTSFIGCSFYDIQCGGQSGATLPMFLGCKGDYSLITSKAKLALNGTLMEDDELYEEEKFILTKFWPVGTGNFIHKHRPIKVLCIRNKDLKPENLIKAINSLKKKGILKEPQNISFVEINFDKHEEIKRILGRTTN